MCAPAYLIGSELDVVDGLGEHVVLGQAALWMCALGLSMLRRTLARRSLSTRPDPLMTALIDLIDLLKGNSRTDHPIDWVDGSGRSKYEEEAADWESRSVEPLRLKPNQSTKASQGITAVGPSISFLSFFFPWFQLISSK